MNKNQHRILWVGFGNFARKLYPFVSRRPDVEAVYFFYPHRDEALRRFGDRGRWNLDDWLADSNNNIVIITTPNHLHTEYLEPALINKKHIFVEKPITACLDEAVKIQLLIERSKSVLMVGHNFRREAAVRKIKSIIDSGDIGQVVSVYANYSKGIAFSMDQKNWRFHAHSHREGPLITVGIHLIDVFHHLLGPIESVCAVLKNVSQKTEAPDSNAVLLTFRNRTTAFLETNYNTPSEETLSVFGTEGSLYLRYGQLFQRLGRDRNCMPSKEILVPFKPVDTLAEEINDFFEAIETGGRIETGYREGVNALAVIDACFQSSVKKQVISMERFPGYFTE